MQVEGIIENPITDHIRAKGHLSIRLKEDSFSVLVSDASFKPVFLKNYRYIGSVPDGKQSSECALVLDGLQLPGFQGETVIITDSQLFTILPESFYDEEIARNMLGKVTGIRDSDRVLCRIIHDRHLAIVYGYSSGIDELAGKFSGEVRVIHSAECLISLSDQVKASDHQRGFALAEVQHNSLHLMVVREDGIVMMNRFGLNEPAEFIYHTLNTYRQLNLDREMIPVYLSGIVHHEHELFGLLGKYIRNVEITPYYLEELSKTDVLRFMILSEGSKCV